MSKEEDSRKIFSTPVEVETESAKMGPPPPPKDVEKQEEEKLKAKYPNLKKMGGGSALLNKRLQKGQKYFDSGDYNMAKAKLNNPKKPLAPSEKMLLQESIGDAIPTPEVLPPRKASITTSKLATDSTS